MGKGGKRKKDSLKLQGGMVMFSGACEAPPEVPGGWNFLYASHKLKVCQSINLIEAVTQGCCECGNYYDVLAKLDGDHDYRKVYRAKEESGCCSRVCCAPNHNFALVLTDHSDQEVLGMYHPMKCAPCCCVCCNMCQHEMFIYAPTTPGAPAIPVPHDDRPCCSAPDNATGLQAIIRQPVCGGVYNPTVHAMSVAPAPTLGQIKELWSETPGTEGFQGSMEIVGPYLCIGSMCDATFKAQAPGAYTDENRRGEYGKIKREGVDGAEDFVRECCTDADNYTIKFEHEGSTFWSEQEWNTKMWNKAKLLSSLFLLDYMFFENEGAYECCPSPGTYCRIKCCDLYCCGALIPCYCALTKGDGDDDSGAVQIQ